MKRSLLLILLLFGSVNAQDSAAPNYWGAPKSDHFKAPKSGHFRAPDLGLGVGDFGGAGAGSSAAQGWTDKTPEGFGASVTGGAGGSVINVTNLNNSGAGSFREAIMGGSGTRGPRIVKFTVSGRIILTSDIEVENGVPGGGDNYDDLTIDGSDAPNHGIQISGKALRVRIDNFVMKHIRVRGDEGDGGDAFALDGASNWLINHCSFQCGDDGDSDITSTSGNNTIQYSIFGPNCGAGSMLLKYNGGGTNISMHHNLFFTAGRTPEGAGPFALDYVNNVIYSNRLGNGGLFDSITHWPPDEGNEAVNLVGNYWKYGSAMTYSVGNDKPSYHYSDRTFSGGSSFYYASNVIANPSDVIQTSTQTNIYGNDTPTIAGSPFSYPAITTTSAAQAYLDVMAYAGAHEPCGLDSLDTTIIGWTETGGGPTNHIQPSIASIGGYPDLTQPCPPSGGTPSSTKGRLGTKGRAKLQ